MPHDISLAQFNAIASGKYNAGQIDMARDADGAVSLVKVNNHVWFKSKNNVQLSPQRVLEVKEAFLAALAEGGVQPDRLNTIRQRLGLSTELVATGDAQQLDAMDERRFAPLSRAEVRSILDTYVAGMNQPAASSRVVARREQANSGAPLKHVDGLDHTLTDAISLLSASRSLTEFDASRAARFTGPSAANDSRLATLNMKTGFMTLFSEALKLLEGSVRESGEFDLF